MSEFTREEIQAEMDRRGLSAKPQSEFTPEEIQAEMQRRGLNRGFSGLGEDVAKMALNAPSTAWEGIKGFLSEAGQAASQTGKQASKARTPQELGGVLDRTALNLGAGALEGTKQVANIPGRLLQHLIEQGIPGAQYTRDNLLQGHNLQIGDTGLQKLILGETRPEDIPVQNVGGIFSLGKFGLKNPVKAGAVMGSASEEPNPFAGAIIPAAAKTVAGLGSRGYELYKDRKSIKPLEKEVNESTAKHDEAYNVLEEFKRAHGVENPEKLSKEIRTKENQIKRAQRRIERAKEFNSQIESPQSVAEIESKYQTPEQLAKNYPTREQLESKYPVPEQPQITEFQPPAPESLAALEQQRPVPGFAPEQVPGLPRPAGELQLEQAKNIHNEQLGLQEKAAQEVLNATGNNLSISERIPQLIAPEFEANKARLSENFDKNYSDMNKLKVGIRPTENSINARDNLETFLKERLNGEEELDLRSSIEDLMKELSEPEKVQMSAAKYALMQKNARDLAWKYNNKGYEKGSNLTTGQKESYRAAGREAKKIANQMDNVLKESLTESGHEGVYDQWKQNAKDWGQQVAPTYGSRLWKDVLENKKIPGKDFVSKAAGENEDLQLFRDYVKQNPEASAYMIGSRIGEKAELLHEPHESLLEYIEAAPHVKRASEAHKVATEGYKRSKTTLENVQSEADRLKFIKEEKDADYLRTKEAEKNARTEKEKEQLTEHEEKIERERKRFAQEIKELEAKHKAEMKEKESSHVNALKERESFINAEERANKNALSKDILDVKSATRKEINESKSKKQANIQSSLDKIEDLNVEIDEIQRIMPELIEAVNAKDISLKEKMAKQEELKIAKEKVNSAKKKILFLLTGSGALGGYTLAANKAENLFRNLFSNQNQE